MTPGVPARPPAPRALPTGLYAMPPGLWCVPSALVMITGADIESVVHPALNRHGHEPSLTGLVVGASMRAAVATLGELGYTVRRYRGDRRGCQVRTLAKLSAERWPGHTLLVSTIDHALVVRDGRVFDNHHPHGPAGDAHSYARCRVQECWLIGKGGT